ncbi:MAG: hypothetical protein LBS69_03515, partial [Prevotellaceae bacterium]|nr:hypothetical protein [Prevotellaceae bacterium]
MKKLILKLLIFVLPTTINAQISLNNEITLPSSDVWNFMKYGDVGTNLYTGTLNLKIPIYTYKDVDFEIPVSIDYSSNGYIPNIRTGILGLGWNLNVGGYITREVKGLPDETNGEILESFAQSYPLSKNDIRSDYLYEGVKGFSVRSSVNGNQFTPSMDNLFCVSNASGSNLLFFDPTSNLEYPYFDAEPDVYHFNFMGYSGSFHLNYNGEVLVYNTNTNNHEFKVMFGTFPNITIISSNGYKYVFGYSDNRKVCDGYSSQFSDQNTITAYKLIEIIAPNGRKIKFYYNVPYTQTNYYLPTELHKKRYEIGDYANGIPPFNYIGGGSVKMQYSDAYSYSLDYIQIDNGIKVIFDYIFFDNIEGYYLPFNDNIEYPTGVRKLSKIRIIDPSMQETIKQIDINYKHTNFATSNKIPFINKINISGEGEYIMNYYGENEYFPFLGHCCSDHWGYYNGTNTRWDDFVNSIQNPGLNEIIPNTREPNPLFSTKGLLHEIIYPTNGKSVFEYESHNYSQYVDRKKGGGILYSIENDKIAGGLRIKKIINFFDNGIEANRKEFLYINESGRSSGKLLWFPHYSIEYSIYFYSPYQATVTPHYSFREIAQLYSLSGFLSVDATHIEYDRIIEKNSDNSNIIYNYSNYSNISDKYIFDEPFKKEDAFFLLKYNNTYYGDHKDCWKKSHLGIPCCSNQYNCPTTSPMEYFFILFPPSSMQAERGKLLSKEIYDANGNIVLKETNSYNTQRNLKYFPTPIYLARQYGFYLRYIDNFELISTTKKQYFNNAEINENISYTYNTHGQVATTSRIDSKGDKIVTKQKYVTDLANPAGIHKKMLDNNVINEPIEDSVYIIKSGTTEKTLMEWRKYNYYQ